MEGFDGAHVFFLGGNIIDGKAVFEILVREHASSLMIYLRSVVRDGAVAEDLFQETMLVAWKNMDRFDRQRPFGPWLRGIAGKLVLNWYRTARNQPRRCDEGILEQIDERLTQIQQLQGDTLDEKLDALRDCMDRLPGAYRQAIDLRYREELKPAAITKQLQLSAENVKKRLQRARAMLLDCLMSKLPIVGDSHHA